MKTELIYLENIRDCIENIETDTAARKTTFFNNRMMQDAVIHNLEITEQKSNFY